MSSFARVRSFVRRRPWSAAVVSAAALIGVLGVVRATWTVWSSFDPVFGSVLALPNLFELAVVAAGLVIIAKGLPYRVGESLHCSRCGYERVEEHDRLLINCPECGHYWRLFGGWRRGKPIVNRRLVKIGMLVCGCGLVVVLGRGLASRWITERLSSAMLMRHVLYAPTEVATQAWDAIGRRTLTGEQIRWLGSELISRRAERGWLDSQSVQWFHDRMADGSMPTEVVTRYFEDCADFVLVTPVTAEVGAKFEATVVARYRGSVLTSPEGPITLACGGVSIELPPPSKSDAVSDFERQFLAGPTWIGPEGATTRLVDPFDTRKVSSLATLANSARFVGVAKVRAVAWIIVGPPPHDGVEFTPDGQIRTSSPAVRVIRRELTREIEIVKAGEPRPE